MLRIGHVLIYLAIVIVVPGLALGLGALIMGFHELAVSVLVIVPAGVLLGFAGLVLIVMVEPRS